MVPLHGKEPTFVEVDIHPSLLAYCPEELDRRNHFFKRVSEKENIIGKS